MADTAGPRQQVLQLWLASAALDTAVVAWAFYDGTDGSGPALPDTQPPYPTGVAALHDGWLLLAVPAPLPADAPPGALAAGFTFERRIG